MQSAVLLLIINLLIVKTTNAQAEMCDCDDDYGKPFCDGIEDKDRDCYVNGSNMTKLSAKGTHCAKSCGTCCMLPRFQCEDRAARLNCASVKATGLCKTTNGELLSLISAECPKTCGLCGQECVDSDPLICSILKSSCKNEESKSLCPKTCSVCQPPNLCFDTTEYCLSLKKYCNHSKLKPLMLLSCNETCGICHSESSPIPQPTAEPCVDTDSRCPLWEANGFCTNLFYRSMVKKCRKTCNLCGKE